MRIALLGAPGSGKGTQAKLLAERYRVPHISTGDLLRDAVASNSKLDKSVKQNMEAGELVADDIVLKLLEDRLRKKDTKRGFIIDGYPRSIPQAQALDALLGILGRALQIAVNVSVDDDVLIKRITGRIGCKDCDAIYNKYFTLPKVRNKCDKCGGKLVSKSDDTEKTVGVKVAIYHENTAPLFTYYRAQHKLRNMPAKGNIEEIHGKISEIVDIEIRPLEIKTLETAAETHDEEDLTIIAGGQINRLPSRPAPPVSQDTKAPRSQEGKAKPEAVSKSAGEKKPIDKKTITKKASTKKTTSKKAAKKKAVAKKPVAKGAVAKKTTQKKTSAKKSPKKAPVKKAAVTKKTPVKKAVTKKVAAKKVATKKVAAKKTVTKKVAKKKASAKKK